MLYASVGHAGASGYLAAMALLGIPPPVMRPSALVLNILVASVATVKFYRAGYFSWPILRSFVLVSAPFAWLGGTLTLPSDVYKRLIGMVLLFAAIQILRVRRNGAKAGVRKPPFGLAMVCGGGIGLLSGLTGVGGGIFLSPLLLLMGWAEMRQVAAVSAAFILVNSIFGLLGKPASVMELPASFPIWALCAIGGGWVGAEWGSHRFAIPTLRRLLSVVLILAGLKMVVGW